MSQRGAAGVKAPPLLVIEDEGSVLNFLRMALERHGYACAAAHSAAEGIRLLESGEFDGIISDMRTPAGVSAADVHAWIVKNRPHLKARILFLTRAPAMYDTIH